MMPFDRRLQVWRCSRCDEPVEKPRGRAYCKDCWTVKVAEYRERKRVLDSP